PSHHCRPDSRPGPRHRRLFAPLGSALGFASHRPRPPMLEYDPQTTDKRQIYRLLTGAVVPRPIGWASTINAGGAATLAPFSFSPGACVTPPMISLTIARNPDGSEKHTLKNVRANGEFCFNVVTQPVWKEMVDSANGIPEEDSEFEV